MSKYIKKETKRNTLQPKPWCLVPLISWHQKLHFISFVLKAKFATCKTAQCAEGWNSTALSWKRQLLFSRFFKPEEMQSTFLIYDDINFQDSGHDLWDMLGSIWAIPRFFPQNVNGCSIIGFSAVLCNLAFMAIWKEILRQGPSYPVSPVFTQKFTTFQQTAFSQLYASFHSNFLWDSLLFSFFMIFSWLRNHYFSPHQQFWDYLISFTCCMIFLWGWWLLHFYPFKQIFVSLFKVYTSAK